MTRPASDPSRGPLTATGVKILVSRPVHRRLRDLKGEMTRFQGREVTFTEVIEELLALLDGQASMVRDIGSQR